MAARKAAPKSVANVPLPLDEDAPAVEVEAKSQPNENVIVSYMDTKFEVLPVKQWSYLAMQWLNQGNVAAWLTEVLTDDSLDEWIDLNPDMEKTYGFVDAFNEATKTDPLASRAARRAFARTQMRSRRT